MIEIRALRRGDGGALLAFFRGIPEGDRTFFKEDVRDPRLIAAWLSEPDGRRFVACDGERVVGYIGVVPGTEWSSHVAELRVAVQPSHRGQGIGRTLARRGMARALELGFRKLVVDTLADEESTIALFNGLGFEGEALLRDHVRTRDGESRDLIVLAHFVERSWSEMETVGLADELQ